MSDLGTVAFDTSEKVDILIKDAFNVSSTNENTPWRLPDKALTYATHTFILYIHIQYRWGEKEVCV